MIDEGRNIVGMSVNTVSTMTTDVLGEREHEKVRVNENLPGLAGATREGRTTDIDNAGCRQ